MFSLLLFVTSYAAQITPDVLDAFKEFQIKYHKSYDEMEYISRLGIFADNLELVAKQNKEHVAIGGEEVFGVTKFMDLTPEEFRSMYLTARPRNIPDSQRYTPPKIEVADSVDWRTKGAVTKVKDQGQCGSCWAFSAVDAIESYGFLDGNYTLVELSTQQVNACDKQDGGCNGGDTITAYEYVVQAGGIESEKEYPYTAGGGRTGLCKFKADKVVEKIKGHKVLAKSEDALQTELQHGPASVCVAATAFQTYNRGILKLCPGLIDHCVQTVGYDTDENYWLVRNSWNTDWGEDGYIRLEMGKNICKIANEITYPTF